MKQTSFLKVSSSVSACHGALCASTLGEGDGEQEGTFNPTCPEILYYYRSFTRRTEQPLEREKLDCGKRSI